MSGVEPAGRLVFEGGGRIRLPGKNRGSGGSAPRFRCSPNRVRASSTGFESACVNRDEPAPNPPRTRREPGLAEGQTLAWDTSDARISQSDGIVAVSPCDDARSGPTWRILGDQRHAALPPNPATDAPGRAEYLSEATGAFPSDSPISPNTRVPVRSLETAGRPGGSQCVVIVPRVPIVPGCGRPGHIGRTSRYQGGITRSWVKIGNTRL